MTPACPSCGAGRQPDARFCAACGAPLERRCRACGTEAPAEAAFCSRCGAALDPDAAHGAGVDDHEERRVVTVLFADLAGSTALGERLDPEDVRALQQELFEFVHGEVRLHGGLTEKFVGDAVLAVFGVPLAHGDDAERAVRAALSIRDRFPAFADRARERHRAELGIRLGVNTGEVVAGRAASARGELVVSGDAVNVAARLQQAAAPGRVLVGARTHASTARSIRYAGPRALDVRGKRAPLAAWEAVDALTEPGDRAAGRLTAPLIGRDDELAILRALTGRVQRERLPQLVTLLGPAGVGKSRLVAEYARSLPGARLLRGRCPPYGGGLAYRPLAEAATAAAGILDSDAVDVAGAKLRSAVAAAVPAGSVERVAEAIAWTIGLELPEAGLEGADVRGRLRDAWAAYLRALGSDRLTLLVVEDLHWGSEPLLELLEEVAAALDDTAVLLLCTARAELVELRRGWGAGRRNAATLELPPLRPGESAALVDALLGGPRLPAELADAVLARAEGNPFYVEEILQMLIERGVLARRDGGWSLERPLGPELPDSVQGVIAARLDLLDAAPREALRRCSVMGRTFWPGAVDVGDELVAQLARRGLVAELSSSTVEGMREFAFKHALTQEVAYASLPRGERRELHRRVGEWVERTAGGREAESAELAGYHFERALASGEHDEPLVERTFELLLRAGTAARARAAFRPAASLFERAAALPVGEARQARALVELARSVILAGDEYHPAIEQLHAARGLAESAGDAVLLADVLGWLSRACWLASRWGDALDAATEAVEVLAGRPESPELARALARRSQLQMLRGDPRAERHAEEAIGVARRSGDTLAEANARTNLTTARAMRGVAPDEREVRDVVRLARDAGHVDEAYRAAANYLWSAQASLPLPALERSLDELRALLADVPLTEFYGDYVSLSVAVLLDVPAGRWAPVEELLRSLPRAPAGSGSSMLWHELAGGLALRRGDLAAARAALLPLVELALESDEAQRVVPMAGVVLPYAVAAGDPELLRRVGGAALGYLERRWEVVSVASVARALARGRADDLLRRLAGLVGVSSGDSGHRHVAVDVVTGLVALADGEPARAADALAAAAASERGRGWAYRAACIEVDLAEALAAAGRGDEAEAARARADAVLAPLGVVNPY